MRINILQRLEVDIAVFPLVLVLFSRTAFRIGHKAKQFCITKSHQPCTVLCNLLGLRFEGELSILRNALIHYLSYCIELSSSMLSVLSKMDRGPGSFTGFQCNC